jgi:hypothetical protein
MYRYIDDHLSINYIIQTLLTGLVIINFPHLESSTTTAPAYGVYISQLIRYIRVCSLLTLYF